MKTYKIHLLRHGLTEANLSGLCAGTSDFPLLDEGKAELEALRDSGCYPYAERYFCSPLLRCRQSMAAMYPDAEPEIAGDLHEHDFGVFEGRPFAELADEPAFVSWLKNGGQGEIPGGESMEAMLRRVSAAFDRIVKDLMSHGQTSAVICTHGGVMMALLSAYGLPERPAADYMVGNGRGFTLRITPSVWMRGGKFEIAAEIPEGDAFSVRGEQMRMIKELAGIEDDSEPLQEV